MDSLFWGPFGEYLKYFAIAFIPLFVAMEPIGVIPVYMSVTGAMEVRERSRVLSYSIVTAAIITLVFLMVGKAVFTVLGITAADFQIAGGLVLLSIAVSDIVQTARGIIPAKPAAPGIGIVPLGTPLIAGPAALTTILMLNDLYGLFVTALAIIANLFIIWAVLSWSDSIVRYIGENGARGISKVISLLLAAIAVMMIRRGLSVFIG